MPPQQPDRLLDIIDNGLDFGAHGSIRTCYSERRGIVGKLMSGSADHKARAQLLGTWTLVSAVREEIPSGATTNQFGEGPHGYLTYSPEGRMMALITRRDRNPPAA